MAPGSITHHSDMHQRYVELPLVTGGGVPRELPSIQFQVPTNRNKLPMGYFMMFLVTNVGVPSVGKFVLVEP